MDDIARYQGIVLPFLWIAVATAVALTLYRTSKSFITGNQLFGFPVKQVRLGGSIVLFVIVFMLLRQATTADTVYVPAATIAALDRKVESVDAARVDVDTCLETDTLDTNDCRAHVERLRDRWRELKLDTDALAGLAGLSNEDH